MGRAKTTRFAATAAALLVLLSLPAVAQTATKVAVFDPQRVSEETQEGQRAQTTLEAVRDHMQQEMTALEQTVADLQERLKQQALSLSIDKRTELEMDIQRKMLELSTLKDRSTRQLQLEIAGAEARFNEKLRNVVDQVGRAGGFAVVLDVSTVAWASTTVDVTTQVIDVFDKAYPVTPQP